jgi:hypothetical protein
MWSVRLRRKFISCRRRASIIAKPNTQHEKDSALRELSAARSCILLERERSFDISQMVDALHTSAAAWQRYWSFDNTKEKNTTREDEEKRLKSSSEESYNFSQ